MEDDDCVLCGIISAQRLRTNTHAYIINIYIYWQHTHLTCFSLKSFRNRSFVISNVNDKHDLSVNSVSLTFLWHVYLGKRHFILSLSQVTVRISCDFSKKNSLYRRVSPSVSLFLSMPFPLSSFFSVVFFFSSLLLMP